MDPELDAKHDARVEAAKEAALVTTLLDPHCRMEVDAETKMEHDVRGADEPVKHGRLLQAAVPPPD